MLKLKYLSHSSFVLSDGTYNVIIDPFISGNPTTPVSPDDIKADFIVLTHAHGDHWGDAKTIAQRNDATIITVNELAEYAKEEGLKAHNMHIGGGWNFPFGRVKLTIAHHGSCLPDGRYMGNPCGAVITMGGKKVYHAGDTGLFLDMKLIGELDKLDAALLPIGDNFTMGIDDAVKAVEFLSPGLAIPMHYDTFPVLNANPNEFKLKTESLGFKSRVLGYGEEIEL